MRVETSERGLIQKHRVIPCGSLIPMLAKKSYLRKQHCDRWSCEVCKTMKIAKCQNAVRNGKLAISVWVGEHPPIITEKEAKAFSNFLVRKVKHGSYWTVRSDKRTVIISKSPFPDAVRLRSGYVIDSLIPDVLSEPWDRFFTKRFTRPQGQKEQKKENTDSAYAQWIGEEGGDEAMKQFTALKTDPERAKWLLHHIKDVNLYNRGKEILVEYETLIRGASPPEPPRQLQL